MSRMPRAARADRTAHAHAAPTQDTGSLGGVCVREHGGIVRVPGRDLWGTSCAARVHSAQKVNKQINNNNSKNVNALS